MLIINVIINVRTVAASFKIIIKCTKRLSVRCRLFFTSIFDILVSLEETVKKNIKYPFIKVLDN